MGYQLGFNYLYQVSGFCSGPASHIGFFTDYLKISPLELSALNYGLYIKHMLSALPNIFLSYGLGTTQSFFEDYPSRTIGHLTKLEAGWYVPDSKFYLGLLYEFHILPLATEKEKSLSFNSVHFNLGYQLK